LPAGDHINTTSQHVATEEEEAAAAAGAVGNGYYGRGGFGDSEGPKGKNTEPTEEQNETARETETETAKEKERAGESYDLDCLMLG